MTLWAIPILLLASAVPARAEEHGHHHEMVPLTTPPVDEEKGVDQAAPIGAKFYLPPPPNNTGAVPPKPLPVTNPPPGGHHDEPVQTDPNAGPIPGSLTKDGLEREKQRLIKAYPESKLAIERVLSEPGLDGVVRPRDIEKFEDYIRSRSNASSIIRKYWPDMPEDPSGKNEAEMRRKFDAVVQTMKDTNPKDLLAFQGSRDRLSQTMDTVMQTGLANAVHKGDTFLAERLHTNPDQHDEDWKNNRPNDPFPFSYSGNRQFQEGNFGKAVQDLSRAIALNPGDARALTMRGAAYREMGDFEAAARDAAAALAINPNDKAAQNVYALSAGRTHLKAKEIAAAPAQEGSAGAASQAAFASAANPASSLALLTAKAGTASREAGKQFALGDYEKAARMAAEAAEKNPNDLLARFYQSAALGRMKDHAGALSAADAGLAIDPKSAALHLARAQALNRLGRYRDALASASAAAQLNPRDPGALIASAEAYAGLGDRAAAIDALKRAAALDPRFAPLAEEAAALSADEDLLALLQGGSPARPAGGPGLSGLMGRAGGVGTAAGAGILGVLLALAVGIALNLRRERDSNPR